TTNKQPSIESLQKGTSLDSREITAIIQNLIQRDLLELNVNKDEEGKFTEYMNLDQFYHKLNDIMQYGNNNSNQKQVELEFNKLFQQINQAFGRPLSPYEIETLHQWLDIDKHDLTVIQSSKLESTSNN